MAYCLCKGEPEGEMIGCDRCDDWFHLDCVGLTEKQVSLLPDEWFCTTCQPFIQKEAIKEVLFSEECKDFMKGLIAEFNSTEALNRKIIKPSEQVIQEDVHKQCELKMKTLKEECELKMKTLKEECELKMKTLKEEYEGKVEKMIEDYNNNENKTKEEIQEVCDKKLIEEKIKTEELCEEKLQQYVSQIQSLEEEIKQLKRRIANKRKSSLAQQHNNSV